MCLLPAGITSKPHKTSGQDECRNTGNKLGSSSDIWLSTVPPPIETAGFSFGKGGDQSERTSFGAREAETGLRRVGREARCKMVERERMLPVRRHNWNEPLLGISMHCIIYHMAEIDPLLSP